MKIHIYMLQSALVGTSYLSEEAAGKVRPKKTMETLLLISVTLLAGLMMSRVVKKLELPAVTAYLIAGILIGPFCIGRLNIAGFGFQTLEQVKGFELLSDIALGFIAFAIGNEFRLSQLKDTG